MLYAKQFAKVVSSISIILSVLKKSVYTGGKSDDSSWLGLQQTFKHLKEMGLYFLYKESFSLV